MTRGEAMSAATRRSNLKLGILIACFASAAMALLFVPERHVPPFSVDWYWNGAVAFLLTAFLCDAWSLRTFANLSTSVAFLPLFASIMLFDHPIPMAISGLTAAIAETFVRKKPAERVLFNTCQYMVSLGLGGLVYGALGGHPMLTGVVMSGQEFAFKIVPFIGLVLTYFVVNQGSVALAVAFSSDVGI